MSLRHPMRTVLVALSGALVLTGGPVLLTTSPTAAISGPAAAAAPRHSLDNGSRTAQESDYPFGGDGSDSDGSEGSGREGSGRDSRDGQSGRDGEDGLAGRAEEAVGGLASAVIDLNADMLKCGLSIVLPNIDCPL